MYSTVSSHSVLNIGEKSFGLDPFWSSTVRRGEFMIQSTKHHNFQIHFYSILFIVDWEFSVEFRHLKFSWRVFVLKEIDFDRYLTVPVSILQRNSPRWTVEIYDDQYPNSTIYHDRKRNNQKFIEFLNMCWLEWIITEGKDTFKKNFFFFSSYGLPVNFAAILIRSSRKNLKRLHECLSRHYDHLDLSRNMKNIEVKSIWFDFLKFHLFKFDF